ncbi:DNA glycosylase AlkZ-like family protein [Bacteroidota bacterium]
MIDKNKFRYWSHHRQLLDKSGTNLNDVLRSIIGVYSSHPSGPLSLYARVRSFSEKEFYKLDEKRLAIRVPAMRQSVYMLPTETARLAVAATIHPSDDPYWEKRYSQKYRAISKDKYKLWQVQILKIVTRPLAAAEIKQTVKIPDQIFKSVLNRMAFEGSLLRIGAKSLRSNIISYVSTKSWIKEHSPRLESINKSLVWLAGEYLRVFGPARIKDFQWWAGIAVKRAKEALAAHETVPISTEYILRSNDLKEFESYTKPMKDNLDLLPQWDCYTMGYAPDGRRRFVDPEMQNQIYGALGATGGNALGTVLVNGQAYGSWNHRFKGRHLHITLNMFEKPSNLLNKDIIEKFGKIAELLKASDIILDKK